MWYGDINILDIGILISFDVFSITILKYRKLLIDLKQFVEIKLKILKKFSKLQEISKYTIF